MTHPVRVRIAADSGQGRLWGLFGLGSFIRALLVIPHVIVMGLLGLVAWVALLVNWLPVLVNGRQAAWIYDVVGGLLRMSTRIALYVALVTGAYPPFGPGGSHAVELEFDRDERQGRLWGIPVLGVMVRGILLIPHAIVLAVLAFIVSLLTAISWIPVLITGRQADFIVQIVGGYYRWSARVTAYSLLLTAAYPPFSLD